MGGCFVSIGRYNLRKIVTDPTGLRDYFKIPFDDGGPTGQQTVQQAWDVIQNLLPETVNGNMLEDCDLGEICLYLTPSQVIDAHTTLLTRDVSALVKQLVNEPARYSDLYWANVWLEDPAWLERIMLDTKQLFATVATRGDAIIFYVT